METYKDCPICNKHFYIAESSMWGYTRRIGNRYYHVCSWSCVNDKSVHGAKRRGAYEGDYIKKELAGNCGSPTSIKQKKWEREELEYKRRDIEKSLKKKGGWVQ